MATWQRRSVRFKSTLATKMSVPGYDEELIEAVLRNLRSVPLEPSAPQRNALARLKLQLEEALGALDDLERSGGLSTEERKLQGAFRVLRRAIEELEWSQGRRFDSKIRNMDRDGSLQRLKQALRVHREALEELESALLEFEESISGEAQERPQERQGLNLLSIPELCQELGMGKSWVYRRLRSGEIPSVKLGRSIKVKREDLEEYLESRRHWPPGE